MEIFTYLAFILIPAIIATTVFFSKRLINGKVPTLGIGGVFLGLLWMGSRTVLTRSLSLEGVGFRIEPLGLMLSLFILFVSGIVHLFSIRYLSGDQKFNSFFMKLGFLTSSLLLMIGADHLILMVVFWTLSNFILGSLMIHKDQWSASRNSGILMFKISALASASIAVAIGILFYSLGTFSIHEILEKESLIAPSLKGAALLLLILAALIQSGTWPFHQWLLSSLNSPTPVSGLMHAGLVNGGGFLLARFVPLFSESNLSLHILFVLGLISVILGTGWKLIQSNIKSMLACSTMAQMGFMLMQCGLGLFSAAIAHLFWHGLFKCYLFLNSGSAILEKKEISFPKNRGRYLLALLAGLAGTHGFALIMGFLPQARTTQTVLFVFLWLASTEIAYVIMQKGLLWIKLVLGSIGAFIFGIVYGSTIYTLKYAVSPVGIDFTLPLQPLHFLGIGIVLLLSLGINFNLFSLFSSKRVYVEMLNLSQSDPKTTTLLRNQYKY